MWIMMMKRIILRMGMMEMMMIMMMMWAEGDDALLVSPSKSQEGRATSASSLAAHNRLRF
jgi:hypothetical protein